MASAMAFDQTVCTESGHSFQAWQGDVAHCKLVLVHAVQDNVVALCTARVISMTPNFQ